MVVSAMNMSMTLRAAHSRDLPRAGKDSGMNHRAADDGALYR